MSRMLAHAVAIAVAGLIANSASADLDPSRLRAVVDAAIQPVVAEHRLPGMAVAVTVDGKALFFNYGVASRETGTPVSENTIFELGSVSKVFTATLALYAQALGRLALGDHPGRYMPELQGRPIDRATLLDLGTYTAGGLPLQVPEEVSDMAGMVRYFQAWRPDAEPGALRQYSNPSIGLFGHIAAIALQRDFVEAVESDLLPAFGLQHTFVRLPASAAGDYAWGYDKDDHPTRVRPDVFDAEAYGIKSTSADMIRLVQINIDASGLAKSMRQAVEGTQLAYFEVGDMVQGLGWEQYPYPVALDRLLKGNSDGIIFEPNAAKAVERQEAGARLFNKTGSTRGFGAYLAFVPAKRIGIVLLANRSYPIADRVRAAYAILSWLAAQAKR